MLIGCQGRAREKSLSAQGCMGAPIEQRQVPYREGSIYVGFCFS